MSVGIEWHYTYVCYVIKNTKNSSKSDLCGKVFVLYLFISLLFAQGDNNVALT